MWANVATGKPIAGWRVPCATCESAWVVCSVRSLLITSLSRNTPSPQRLSRWHPTSRSKVSGCGFTLFHRLSATVFPHNVSVPPIRCAKPGRRARSHRTNRRSGRLQPFHQPDDPLTQHLRTGQAGGDGSRRCASHRHRPAELYGLRSFGAPDPGRVPSQHPG